MRPSSLLIHFVILSRVVIFAFLSHSRLPFTKPTNNLSTIFHSKKNNENDNHDSLNSFSDGFDSEELRDIIARRISNEDRQLKDPDDVHIILFNPDTPNEGVHTIEYPKGSGKNIILAFESKKECVKFSNLLREQHFFDPKPQEIKLDCLKAYCESLGLGVQVVPEGLDIRPPKENVENLGMNPNLYQEMEFLDYLIGISPSESSNSLTSIDSSPGAWE